MVDYDIYSDYTEWERRMGRASDYEECQRPDMPSGNSSECPCAPCEVACWWDGLDGLEKGVLYAGMCKQGFEWTKEPDREPCGGEGKEG